MAVLPPTVFDLDPNVEYKTYLPDGLHFFRGVRVPPLPFWQTQLTFFADPKYTGARDGVRDPSPAFRFRPYQT